MDLTLSSPVQYVPRVGPRMAALLEKLDIRTVEDLLWYVPFRYDDFSLISPISRVRTGEVVTISGAIQSIVNLLTKSGKHMQQAIISDETGKLTVIWFNQPFLVRMFPAGTPVRLAGKIDWFGNKIVMTSPSYEVVPQADPTQTSGSTQHTDTRIAPSLHMGRLVPIYPETAGITSKWLRSRISYVLEHVLPQVREHLPDSLLSNYQLMPLGHAIASVQFPKKLATAQAARHRLAFDELLLLQLHGYLLKIDWQKKRRPYSMKIDQDTLTSFITTLPFTLTDDQLVAINEIMADVGKPFPMNRLLIGDVGSGKTVVAAAAMYVAWKQGLQSVLMAPTQILTEQHFQTMKQFLEPFGIRITIRTSTQKKHDANADVIVGTHSLISETITFQNLGLIVIDEQHRFGVSQRAALVGKGAPSKTPHVLTMTATPIPRTVAHTMFGNLDFSTLTHMPQGRQKVKTWVVPNEKRTSAYQWITKQIEQTHGQTFIICPLIEESETISSVRAATSEYKKLQTIFPAFQLGLLHGRMKPQEKTKTLDLFRNGTIDILVTTPVVEVGIDVPNATIMLIEAAERFGLSQLHQLRGRVGRGALESYCLLCTEQEAPDATERLKHLERIHSGPELAEIDLSIRGPGELFGTRQHGIPILKIARFSDRETIQRSKNALTDITKKDPQLLSFPLLRQKAQKGTMEATQQD